MGMICCIKRECGLFVGDLDIFNSRQTPKNSITEELAVSLVESSMRWVGTCNIHRKGTRKGLRDDFSLDRKEPYNYTKWA